MIGQGAFGRVFLGLNVDSGELLAVKQMDVTKVNFMNFVIFVFCPLGSVIYLFVFLFFLAFPFTRKLRI
jgi:serine/threonine protein kinase